MFVCPLLDEAKLLFRLGASGHEYSAALTTLQPSHVTMGHTTKFSDLCIPFGQNRKASFLTHNDLEMIV